MSVVPTLGGPGRGWVIGVDMVCRRICLEEPVRWPAGHRRSAVTLAVTKTLGSGLPVHTREDVSPPVCLHAVSDPRVPRESPEPPDEKAALGAAPGARVDNRLPTREVREVGPVVRVGEDRVVAVVLVMAVRIGREVDVAGVGACGVDLRMAGVGLRRAGEVLSVAAALPIKPIPESQADAGLDERLSPMPEVVEHLRDRALVAEAHDHEPPGDLWAERSRLGDPVFEVSEPRPAPEPYLVDPFLRQGLAGTSEAFVIPRVEDSRIVDQGAAVGGRRIGEASEFRRVVNRNPPRLDRIGANAGRAHDA